MQPVPDNTSALFTLSFHACSCTHVAQDVAYKRSRRINIGLLPHGLSACERSSRKREVDSQTHTCASAHTEGKFTGVCGPWSTRVEVTLSPGAIASPRDKPGIPAGLADAAYRAGGKTMENLPSSCAEPLLSLFFTALNLQIKTY